MRSDRAAADVTACCHPTSARRDVATRQPADQPSDDPKRTNAKRSHSNKAEHRGAFRRRHGGYPIDDWTDEQHNHTNGDTAQTGNLAQRCERREVHGVLPAPEDLSPRGVTALPHNRPSRQIARCVFACAVCLKVRRLLSFALSKTLEFSHGLLDLCTVRAASDIGLEHRAGKSWRRDAAKIAALVGRRQVVDVERAKFGDGPLLRQPETAARP
jgi:hypothetical protein